MSLAKSAVNEFFHFHRATPLTYCRYAGGLSAVKSDPAQLVIDLTVTQRLMLQSMQELQCCRMDIKQSVFIKQNITALEEFITSFHQAKKCM
jgi:hypothetical protein